MKTEVSQQIKIPKLKLSSKIREKTSLLQVCLFFFVFFFKDYFSFLLQFDR